MGNQQVIHLLITRYTLRCPVKSDFLISCLEQLKIFWKPANQSNCPINDRKRPRRILPDFYTAYMFCRCDVIDLFARVLLVFRTSLSRLQPFSDALLFFLLCYLPFCFSHRSALT